MKRIFVTTLLATSLLPALASNTYRDWLQSTAECRNIGIGDGRNASVVHTVAWTVKDYQYGFVERDVTHRAYLKISNSGVFGFYNIDRVGLTPMIEYNVTTQAASCDTTDIQRQHDASRVCANRLNEVGQHLELIRERRVNKEDPLAWNLLSCLHTLFANVQPQ